MLMENLSKKSFRPDNRDDRKCQPGSIGPAHFFPENRRYPGSKRGPYKAVFLIDGFLAGCLTGALLSKCWGLMSIAVAGIFVISGYLVCSAQTYNNP